MAGTIDVYVEPGAKCVFAGAIPWPGWSRSGKTEQLALEALMAYAPRYAKVVKGFRPAFRIPTDLRVVERLQGDATTDFGAPSKTPNADRRPVDAKELARLKKVLQAAWAAFDGAAEQARGRKLKTGPRGGGRSLAKIVGHVVGAEGSYVGTIRGKGTGGRRTAGAPDGELGARAGARGTDTCGHGGPPREGAPGQEDLDAALFRAACRVARA